MYTIITAFEWQGEFNGIKYTKEILVVYANRKNGERGYPQLVSVGKDVYDRTGGKLAGKRVNLLYQPSYGGKYKVAEIQVLN